MDSIESKISKIVDEKTNELEDRRRREFNVVVFNLPEGTSDTGRINKEADENAMLTIASNLGLNEKLQIETSYRLGKKNSDPAFVILRGNLRQVAKIQTTKTKKNSHRFSILSRAKHIHALRKAERRTIRRYIQGWTFVILGPTRVFFRLVSLLKSKL